jgi:hypothetical protein
MPKGDIWHFIIAKASAVIKQSFISGNTDNFLSFFKAVGFYD